MASIRLLRRAEADLEEASAWYQAQSPQAARRFEAAVTATLQRIAAAPELYARVDEQHRLCPVRKFPYLIVYRYQPLADEVVVIAAAHVSQDPPAWQSK